MIWPWLRSLSEDQLVRLAAILVALVAVGYLCSGCTTRIAVHYLPDAEGHARPACRLWESRWLVQGETISGCVVPHGEPFATVETVPAVWGRGWTKEAKGGDQVTGDGAAGARESEARTTEAGAIELPVVGQSGIVISARDDDLGLELGAVLRLAAWMWGLVQGLGAAEGVVEAAR